MVQYLVDAGADIESAHEYGGTPLHQASFVIDFCDLCVFFSFFLSKNNSFHLDWSFENRSISS